MYLARTREISLTVIDSSQAEQGDTQLVKASQQGDQRAYSLLVQRHQRLVFNMVLRMLQDYEEASEITQDTFLAAWHGLPSFRGEARFTSWLYRIAFNCSLKQLERRRRERSLQENMEAEQILEGINRQQRVDEILELRAQQAIVREQIAQLPPRYRSVLILRHLQEMTYEEIADSLTMPIGTVKTQLFRARQLLKERLLAQHLYGLES
jgi:RNA polymerase sigma-70 factor (ECF subfamily)